MTYSIWLEPTLDDAKYLQEIITNLATKYDAPIFEPHITLYSGIPTLQMATKAVLQCIHSQKIRTKSIGIKSSTNLWKTVFVNVRKNDGISRLNRIIKNEAALVTYPFNPHISLIYKTLDANTKCQIIKGLKIKSSFTFDKISIITSSTSVLKWKKMATKALQTA